ncbi:hypothetical protein COEREDRAFT_12083 [Coemansia reversa NRRL 1564]|uniref:Fungal-type protein kinase domain-containing protein n=1 Tax=Coemansia reversa (strain ATCC 12441 / NRRL 1564) TaxID=763665 RepID=A0A2G5B1I8_COERN|nr:hypothetical protein COEREDRAFT_12083 [Coemansia reversa NRRL 1564]|eukprot:PIA12861.1 hypothetical protein COEREDRAFT_12083 [Coemansia reversa NRRL 1564]
MLSRSFAEVRVCIFTSGRALGSHIIDISSKEGRYQYIRLLVDWSLCEWHQLGFDSTVQQCQGLNCWEIIVPPLSADQGDTSNPSTDGINIHAPTSYYFSKAYVVADLLFGRHTRCYPATSIKPAVPVSSKISICREVLVKDAWSFARRNGSSDGSDIEDMLSSNPKFNDHLPKIICGGTVHMDSNGEAIADNADFILGELHSLLYEDEDTRGHFYSHTHMAMTPIGQRLHDIGSVFELIIAVYDALKAHATVLKERNILHRDISENNILFRRDESGNISGILIDFDNAVDSAAAQSYRQPICTGTLPFMSLNNLRRFDVSHIVIDNIGSAMCLVVWLGIWRYFEHHYLIT